MYAFQMCKKTTENFPLLPGICSEIHQKSLNSMSYLFSSPSLYRNTTVYQDYILPYVSEIQPLFYFSSFLFQLTFHSSICLSYLPHLLCCLAASLPFHVFSSYISQQVHVLLWYCSARVTVISRL